MLPLRVVGRRGVCAGGERCVRDEGVADGGGGERGVDVAVDVAVGVGMGCGGRFFMLEESSLGAVSGLEVVVEGAVEWVPPLGWARSMP